MYDIRYFYLTYYFILTQPAFGQRDRICLDCDVLCKTCKLLICLPCFIISAFVMSYFLGLVFKAAYISDREDVAYSSVWNRVNFYNPFDALSIFFGIIAFVAVAFCAFVLCLCQLAYHEKDDKKKIPPWRIESRDESKRIIDVEKIGSASEV